MRVIETYLYANCVRKGVKLKQNISLDKYNPVTPFLYFLKSNLGTESHEDNLFIELRKKEKCKEKREIEIKRETETGR